MISNSVSTSTLQPGVEDGYADDISVPAQSRSQKRLLPSKGNRANKCLKSSQSVTLAVGGDKCTSPRQDDCHVQAQHEMICGNADNFHEQLDADVVLPHDTSVHTHDFDCGPKGLETETSFHITNATNAQPTVK